MYTPISPTTYCKWIVQWSLLLFIINVLTPPHLNSHWTVSTRYELIQHAMSWFNTPWTNSKRPKLTQYALNWFNMLSNWFYTLCTDSANPEMIQHVLYWFNTLCTDSTLSALIKHALYINYQWCCKNILVVLNPTCRNNIKHKPTGKSEIISSIDFEESI